jgi:hypothetical protein
VSRAHARVHAWLADFGHMGADLKRERLKRLAGLKAVCTEHSLLRNRHLVSV